MRISLEFSGLYKPLFQTKARYIHLWGGRGRGGSFTGTQYFLHLVTQDEYFRGYLMREIQADIRESLWRDLKDRIEEAELADDFVLNESQMSALYIPTGNVILSKGFKKSSGKQTAKLKSIAGATHVLIEESEEISEEDFQQLDDSLRTLKGNIQIIQLFNPPSKQHWIIKRWYNLIDNLVDASIPEGFFRAIPKSVDNLLSIFSTYKDNIQNLHESFIANLKSYTGEYFYTIVDGLVSEGVRGRIYKGWVPVKAMPKLYTKFYGLDWGFNDPVALVECEVHNNNLWVEQKIYLPGITNNQLSRLMLDAGIKKNAPIYADSAEPKDIEDMKRLGWNIIPAKKGPGSVLAGIRFIMKYKVQYVETSTDLVFENENYKWRLGQNKLPLDEPEDKHNHLMDALNYAMDYIRDGRSPAQFTFHK
jgi:phage terminase large subunit